MIYILSSRLTVCYGTWTLEIDDLATKMVIFHVELPKGIMMYGNTWSCTSQQYPVIFVRNMRYIMMDVSDMNFSWRFRRFTSIFRK